MRSILSLVILFCLTLPSFSQGGLTAYTDFRNRFYIFDHGRKKLAEEQPVKSYKVGGTHIAYVDYADNFKVYSAGKITKLEIGRVEDYFVTDYLVAYTMVEMLKVHFNGKTRTVSTSTTEFSIGDSLILYFDKYFNTVNSFIDGKVSSKRLRLVSSELEQMKAVANIGVVLASEDRNLWAFYRGETYLINEYVGSPVIEMGTDIVAYVDRPTNTFKAFYKGEYYDLEEFQPRSFQAGNGRVAYVDNLDNFKAFTQGRIATITNVEPSFYQVKDSMIVYGELGRLKCFYEDRIYEITNYIPRKFEFSRNQILYLDLNGNVNLFKDGKSKVIYMGGGLVNNMRLERDVVVLNVDVNKTIIFYNGVVY